MAYNWYKCMKRLLSIFILMALFCANGSAQMQAHPLLPGGKKPTKTMAPKSVVTSGDTLSYCGNIDYQYNVGYSNSSSTNYRCYWGIMIPSANLAGRNYLKSVMLYVTYSGTYTMNIFTGGTDAPDSLIHTQTNSFENYQTGWNEILLDSTCAIPSGNLWITFEAYGIVYPASASYYCGDANSDWITSNLDVSSWYHAISGESCTWMIKAITSATVPAPAPIVSIYGGTTVPMGDTATFICYSPNATSITWNITADYTYIIGDTAKAVWNTLGTKQVIVTASNSNGTTSDTLEVEVINCTVNTLPHVWDFEDRDEMACWTFVDWDGSVNGWYYYNNPNYLYSPDSSSGIVYSSSWDGYVDNWLMSPAIQLPTGSTALLSWDAGPYSSNLYYGEHYSVYVSTTPNVNNAILLGSFTFTGYSWTHPAINLSAYAGQTIYIAFRHTSGENVLMLDNVTIETVDAVDISCTGNGAGHAYRTTDYSAELCGALEYITPGMVASYDFIATDGALTHLYVNNVDQMANVVTHTSGASVTVHTYSFTTTAGITSIEAVYEYNCGVSTFPYSMGFETNEHYADCWDTANFSDTVIVWNGDTIPYYSSWEIDDYDGYNSSHSIGSISGLYLYHYNGNTYEEAIVPAYPDCWLISPSIQIPTGNTARLSWKTLTYNESLMDYFGIEGYETYSVYVSTSGTDTGNFTRLAEYTNTSDGWQAMNLDLSAYAGQTIHIAFHHTGGTYYLALDNITVESGNLVNINCTGIGSGYTIHTDSYHDEPWFNDLCGTSELLPTGFLASYDFIPSDGDLEHLYVNNVDHINDVIIHSSSTAATYYTYSFTVTGNTTINPVFSYDFYPVTINCSGDGLGYVRHYEYNYNENLCGEIDSVRQGFLASYDFIPSSGNELTHLYVNSVDHINDAYVHSNGTYNTVSYAYSFNVTAATTVMPVFSRIPYTITATSANPSMGMVTGGGNYFYDSIAILTATPMPHYEFLYWGLILDGDTIIIDNEELEEEGFTINPLQFPVQRDMSLVAFFGPENYTVTVAPNNVLYGSVEGGGTFEYLQPVTVSATAYSGYHFQMWSNGSTYNPYTFPASENLDLVAVFIADGDTNQYFAVTTAVNDPTMGTVTGSGVFTLGQTTTLTAVPNTGYHFVQWQDGNTDNPRTITVTADAEYTAYFAADQGITYTLTVLSASDTMGTVTGSGSFAYGDEAELKAMPFEGFRFVQWQDGDTANPRIVIVTSDSTFIATFAPLTGISDVAGSNTIVYSYEKHIFVNGTEGRCVRVFDISGRLLTRVDRAAENLVFTMQHTGVYIVTIGEKAYRVVIR